MKRLIILIVLLFSSCASTLKNIDYILKNKIYENYMVINLPRGYKLMNVINKDTIIEYSFEKMEKEYEPCDYIDFIFNDTIKIRFLEKHGFDLYK